MNRKTAGIRRYSGIRDPSRWSLPLALEEQASRYPDDVWYQGTDGEVLSFAGALNDARRTAGYFASSGVRPNDMVAVMLPNCADFVRVWLGLGMLGAVAVLLNTDQRGALLTHQLGNCGAHLAVVDAGLLAAVAEAGRPTGSMKRICVVGRASQPKTATGKIQRATLRARGAAGSLDRRPVSIQCQSSRAP